MFIEKPPERFFVVIGSWFGVSKRRACARSCASVLSLSRSLSLSPRHTTAHHHTPDYLSGSPSLSPSLSRILSSHARPPGTHTIAHIRTQPRACPAVGPAAAARRTCSRLSHAPATCPSGPAPQGPAPPPPPPLPQTVPRTCVDRKQPFQRRPEGTDGDHNTKNVDPAP